MAGFFTGLWEGIKNTFTTVVNAIKTAVSTAFSAMWNGIKNTISGIYNTIKNGFTNAVNFIKNLASSAFSWGADIINGIVNGIKYCIGKVKDAVSGLATDMVVNPQVNAGQMAMAGGGSVTSADMSSFVSTIKEADSGGETEAGTVQRNVVRTGVVTIAVSFSVTQKWLRLLTGYKQQEKIRVGFFDPETASVRQTEMYVEGFKAKLKKDTSYKGLWVVSFTLKEL